MQTEITILYFLTQAGQKASHLAGGDGKELQTISGIISNSETEHPLIYCNSDGTLRRIGVPGLFDHPLTFDEAWGLAKSRYMEIVKKQIHVDLEFVMRSIMFIIPFLLSLLDGFSRMLNLILILGILIFNTGPFCERLFIMWAYKNGSAARKKDTPQNANLYCKNEYRIAWYAGWLHADGKHTVNHSLKKETL